jgi:hypothetical protein
MVLLSLAKPAEAEPGLLLKQFSARYGSVTCMATGQNFRMDASELRVLLKPPFKQIDMYNMANKTRYNCVIDDLGKDISWHDMSAKEKKAGGTEAVVPNGAGMLQDYKLNRYLIVHNFPHKPSKTAMDFWTTRETDFPKPLETACCKLTGLPVGYGFPVKMYQYQDNTGRNGKTYIVHFKVLETTKVTKQDFPATTFTQPKGFRLAADLMELMVSGDQ